MLPNYGSIQRPVQQNESIDWNNALIVMYGIVFVIADIINDFFALQEKYDSMIDIDTWMSRHGLAFVIKLIGLIGGLNLLYKKIKSWFSPPMYPTEVPLGMEIVIGSRLPLVDLNGNNNLHNISLFNRIVSIFNRADISLSEVVAMSNNNAQNVYEAIHNLTRIVADSQIASNRSFTNMRNDIDVMGTRITNVENRLTNVENRLTNVESEVRTLRDDMNSRFDSLERSIAQLLARQ